MKLTTTTKILLTSTIASISMLMPQFAQAQLPTIVDPQQPAGTTTVVDPSNNNSQQVITAAASTLRVTCQDLKTVVQKGERQAVMVSWNYDGFGKDFSPEKRCQVVSQRLQQAANLNGGTFKDLELASGTVNAQPVICALQSNKAKKCNRQNLLFTLKPENSRNPEAVIKKIFTFAQDGSSSLNESASQQPAIDTNLGNWEQQAFPPSKKPATIKSKNKSVNTGF
jgi:Circadian oscillating protein COP23